MITIVLNGCSRELSAMFEQQHIFISRFKEGTYTIQLYVQHWIYLTSPSKYVEKIAKSAKISM